MKFQKDNYFLIWRIIFLSFIIYLAGFLINKILIHNHFIHLSSSSLNLLIITIILFSFFFLVHSICLSNKILIFKNIYGYTLKKIELKSIKNRNIKYSYNPRKHSIIILFGLFHKKFSRFVQVEIELSNKKVYTINGQILSNSGLDALNSKIKK